MLYKQSYLKYNYLSRNNFFPTLYKTDINEVNVIQQELQSGQYTSPYNTFLLTIFWLCKLANHLFIFFFQSINKPIWGLINLFWYSENSLLT